MPEVVFMQRKPRSVGNYSVEFIFEDVRNRLRNDITARMSESSYESKGLFKRILNCFEAWRNRGMVNHITGDVNYLGLLVIEKAYHPDHP